MAIAPQKRKRNAVDVDDADFSVTVPAKVSRVSPLEATTRDIINTPTPSPSSSSETEEDEISSPAADKSDTKMILQRIVQSNRTPFEKKVWTLLCQIPRGRVSTYGIMSRHLGSSPRAVGNALRRNPFAPQVPCHRVVATGGALGGFKGHPSRNGEGVTIGEKKGLLRGEGVRIDFAGRVLGTPFDGFV